MAAVVPVITSAFSSVGGVLSVASTVLGTMGAIQQGKAAEAQANYQNQLAQQRADAERARGIQASREQRRQGRLALSKARTQGAASGGGLDMDLMGDLAEETEVRALNAIWEGDSRAIDSENAGQEALYEGKSKKRASMFDAAGTILGGATSLYENYG